MARIQLALDVDDLDAAVDFYTRLFSTDPHKRRPGYANFEVADPPLKLVLFEAPGSAGRLNHLGIEVGRPDDVAAAVERLDREGLAPRPEHDTLCCHAVQDKAWVSGPDGVEWEVYTVTDDDPDEVASAAACAPGSPCCA